MKPVDKPTTKDDVAATEGDGVVAPEEPKNVEGDAEPQPAEGAKAPDSEVDPDKEHEVDAGEDTRSKVSATVSFPEEETTINVLQTLSGQVLTTLNDQGCQHLLACARANVGVCKGRYAFEVRVIEVRASMPENGKSQKYHTPQPILRIGLATADSSFFLGDGDSVGVAADGQQITSDVAEAGRHHIYGDQVYCFLVNLDVESVNANTVSLFLDGARVSKPIPIPDSMKGKALFPVVNFKCLSLRMNFGPALVCPLPFSCRSLQEAAAEDVAVRAAKGSGEKCEVLVPVGLPDEGAFDWLDDFVKSGERTYTEISDRALLEWARKSGMQRKRGFHWRNANDSPGMDLGD